MEQCHSRRFRLLQTNEGALSKQMIEQTTMAGSHSLTVQSLSSTMTGSLIQENITRRDAQDVHMERLRG